MASSTTNYNLIKPDYEDNADIKDLNDNFDTIDTAMNNKVDKEIGKGLSTNDYTTAEKTKLDNLAEIKTVGTGLNLDDNGELTATGGGSGGTTNYNDLSNKPQINGNTLSGNKTSAQLGLASASDIPTTLADLSGDSTHRTVSDTEKAAWNNKSDFSGSYNDLTDKPTIPDELSDFTEDATHRTVTDTEKSTWNGKQNAIGSSHKLSADLVDDTNATNKFATAEELEQIETNKNNISKDEASLVELVDGGAKNHINNTLSSGTIPYSNISYTVNTDKSITIIGGTATANADIVIPFSVNTSGTYVLTGGAVGGGSATYKAQIALYPSMANIVALFDNTYTETELSTGTDYAFRFRVYPGQTVPDCTIYPMICTKSAWDISHEYQPYRPSYQELYEMVKTLQAQLANQ